MDLKDASILWPKSTNVEYDFYKVGGILIRDKKLLVTRSKGKEFFIAPGGKVEEGETAEGALARELSEELDISFDNNDASLFGTFYAKAAGEESSTLRMDVFIISKWIGEPLASGEVEEIQWIDSMFSKKHNVGSIFEYDVIPKLKAENKIE